MWGEYQVDADEEPEPRRYLVTNPHAVKMFGRPSLISRLRYKYESLLWLWRDEVPTETKYCVYEAASFLVLMAWIVTMLAWPGGAK